MYKAFINGNIFLNTEIDDDRFTLKSATLIKEKGGAGSFSFVMPDCNIEYDSFDVLKGYVDVYMDDDLLFFGRVFSKQLNFNNSLDILCEGMLAVLSDTIFTPITHDGLLYTLVTALLTSHNLQVEDAKKIYLGEIEIDNSACYRAYENYDTTWKRLCDLVNSYGGFLELKRENGLNVLYWRSGCGNTSTQSIDFGENIINLTKYLDSSAICTVLTPLGKANTDNVRVNISSVNSGSTELYASEANIAKYGYIHKVQIWDDVEVPSNLKSKGQYHLDACLAERYTVNVTAVDLADAGYDIDHFEVGQKIKVTSVPNGIDGILLDVNTVTIPLFNPESKELSIGSEYVGYIKNQSRSVQKIKDELEISYATKNEVDRATLLITGNKGGYVVMRDGDEDGEPDEILVMDTKDILTATKVWRWNKNGLGYSSTGYSGTYGLAMTSDGKIVADYISTGVLSSVNGETSWNLNTGKLTTSSIEITGGSIQIQTSSETSDDFIRLQYNGGGGETYTAIYTNRFKAARFATSFSSVAELLYTGLELRFDGKLKAQISHSSSGGYIRLKGSGTTNTITIEGSSGDITASGTISGGSDIRLKDDIRQLDYAKSAEFIHSLIPKSFKYRANPLGNHHGFIAQDILALLMNIYGNDNWKIVNYSIGEQEEGERYMTLAYMELLADVVATIQTHNDRLKILEAKGA